MKKIEMIKGAKKLVDVNTKVKEGELVLIITDTRSQLSLAEVLAIACRERESEPTVVITSPSSDKHGGDLPPHGRLLPRARVEYRICSP